MEVKISNNFKKVVLVNGNESYLSEYEHPHDDDHKHSQNHHDHEEWEKNDTIDKKYITRMIPQLNGKRIHFIYPDDYGDFFFVAFYEYD